MKKLNRKGFTLIELLAVIVILAVVLVVTIPSVITATNDARKKNLQNAANTVEEWFTKQYELATLGAGVGGGPSTEYTTLVGSTGLTETAKNLDAAVLKAAGITNPTGLTGSVRVNGSKICVILTATDGSQFYNASDTTKNTATGSGC